MSTNRVIQLAVVVGLAALTLPLAQGWATEHTQMGPVEKVMTLEQLQAKHLPMITQALASVRKAVGMGHKEHALIELKKVETMIALVNETISQHIKPAFVNAVCPIMGGIINPTEVPVSLTRDFRGQKVAFCCGSCPSPWDHLSNVKKQYQLTKAHRSHPCRHVGSPSIPVPHR